MPHHENPCEPNPREPKRPRTPAGYVSPEVAWHAAKNGNALALDFIKEVQPQLLDTKTPGDNHSIGHCAILGSQPVSILTWIQSNRPTLLDATNKNGTNLALLALWQNKIDVLEWLWAHKRDLFDQKDDYDNEAATIAAQSDSDASITWLFEKDASMLDKPSGDFPNIAFHVASYGETRKLDWMLLNRPALLITRDCQDDNLAHLALDFEQTQVLQWIEAQESLRPLLSSPNKGGQTPIDLMQKSEMAPIRELAERFTTGRAHHEHNLFAQAAAAPGEAENGEEDAHKVVSSGGAKLQRRPSVRHA